MDHRSVGWASLGNYMPKGKGEPVFVSLTGVLEDNQLSGILEEEEQLDGVLEQEELVGVLEIEEDLEGVIDD